MKKILLLFRKLMLLLYIIVKKEVQTTQFMYNRPKIVTRLNPYNPLSYICLLLLLIVGIIMFGFIGVWDVLNMDELKFKWVETNGM